MLVSLYRRTLELARRFVATSYRSLRQRHRHQRQLTGARQRSLRHRCRMPPLHTHRPPGHHQQQGAHGVRGDGGRARGVVQPAADANRVPEGPRGGAAHEAQHAVSGAAAAAAPVACRLTMVRRPLRCCSGSAPVCALARRRDCSSGVCSTGAALAARRASRSHTSCGARVRGVRCSGLRRLACASRWSCGLDCQRCASCDGPCVESHICSCDALCAEVASGKATPPRAACYCQTRLTPLNDVHRTRARPCAHAWYTDKRRWGGRIVNAAGTDFELDVKYEMIKPIGHGAYGVVISAINHDSDTKVPARPHAAPLARVW
jgi:hypothetical protein